MSRVLPFFMCVIWGCASGRTHPPVVDAEGQSVKPAVRATAVFECGDVNAGGFDFVTQVDAKGLSLWLPLQFGRPYLLLPQVRSASGAKYENDGVVVWVKGPEALLVVDGNVYEHCKLNVRKSIWEDAKLRGVGYRAVGNEPGWHLEITPGKHMQFVYDYGQQTVWTPTPKPVEDGDTRQTVYHAQTEAHNLMVTILGKPCQDSMSGESFGAHVTVVLDGKTFHGCGRALH